MSQNHGYLAAFWAKGRAEPSYMTLVKAGRDRLSDDIDVVAMVQVEAHRHYRPRSQRGCDRYGVLQRHVLKVIFPKATMVPALPARLPASMMPRIVS
jgi:hypothetical protein